MINWDKHTILIGGVEYLIGTAGSLIITCERCGEEHFRGAGDYFRNPEWHQCITCRDPRQPMVPIRYDELDTKWKPLWRSLGIELAEDAVQPSR